LKRRAADFLPGRITDQFLTLLFPKKVGQLTIVTNQVER
jgi:hypothetical protein